MSEEQQSVADPETPAAPQQPAQRPRAQPLALAALVIALGTAVGGYFIWHEVQRQGDWQQQVLGQIEVRGQSVDQRLENFKDRLDADIAAGERARRQLEAAQRDLARGQAGLEDAVGVLRAQVGRRHTDWMLAEVQYLLQVASLRVELDRDVPTAIAALASADQRLQALGDPGFTDVRAAIARELAALRAASLPDLPGIALVLDTLAAEVEKLPLASAQAQERAQPAAHASAKSDYDWWARTRQVLRNIGDALRSLVVIRRNDAPVAPLLAPEQQFFLYENLRLQLTTARLAALQGDNEVYRASVGAASKWLAKHFDAEAASVAAARAELARLATQDIRPALPDVGASLRLLREQMQRAAPPADAMKSDGAAGATDKDTPEDAPKDTSGAAP